MTRRFSSGPSCGRCLKTCPGDAVLEWDRDWSKCDPHRSPHGFAQLTEHLDRIIEAGDAATRKQIPVKVLAKGELSKPLTVHAHAFSKAARERIEAAGGTCQLIEG